VAVFNATRANEVVLSASISMLPQRIAAVESQAPCIILIGVAAARYGIAFFGIRAGDVRSWSVNSGVVSGRVCGVREGELPS
jgi:siroheme synthase